MQFTVVALLLAASANAGMLFGRQSFPTCANDCVANPASLFGCGATDNQCLCTNQQFVDQTTKCIEAACSASDAATAEAFSRSICEQAGVTLTATPSDSASQTASSGASATSSASGASSSGSASAPAPSSTAPTTTGTDTAPSQTGNGAIGNGASVYLGAAAILFAAVNL